MTNTSPTPPEPIDNELGKLDFKTQKQINELRSELLNEKSRRLDLWQRLTALFLTILTIILPLAGYLSIQRIERMEILLGHSVERSIKEVESIDKIAQEANLQIKQAVEEAQTAKNIVSNIAEESKIVFANSQVIERILANYLHSKQSNTGASDGEENTVTEAFKEALNNQANSTSEIDQTINEANLLQQTGNFENAIKKWYEVTTQEGVDNKIKALAFLNIGDIYMDERRSEDAVEAYNKAIDLDSGMSGAFNNRGNAKSDLGLYDEAMADYDEAIRLDSTNALPYFNRGNLRSKRNQFEESIVDYTDAINRDPTISEAFNNRGKAKSHLDRDDEARVDFEEAIRIDPKNANAFMNLGIIKTISGQQEEALADYEESIRLDPENALVYSNRAVLYFLLDRKADARQDFKRALERSEKASDKTYSNQVRDKFKLLFGEDL